MIARMMTLSAALSLLRLLMFFRLARPGLRRSWAAFTAVPQAPSLSAIPISASKGQHGGGTQEQAHALGAAYRSCSEIFLGSHLPCTCRRGSLFSPPLGRVVTHLGSAVRRANFLRIDSESSRSKARVRACGILQDRARCGGLMFCFGPPTHPWHEMSAVNRSHWVWELGV